MCEGIHYCPGRRINDLEYSKHGLESRLDRVDDPDEAFEIELRIEEKNEDIQKLTGKPICEGCPIREISVHRYDDPETSTPLQYSHKVPEGFEKLSKPTILFLIQAAAALRP